MRITFLTEHFYPDDGAQDQINFTLARELVRRGHEVAVVRCLPDSHASDTDHDGIRIYTRPVKYERSSPTRGGRMRRAFARIARGLTAPWPNIDSSTLANLWNLVDVARRERPDVIVAVCHPFEVLQLGSHLARLLRVPYVMYVMDPYFNNPLFPQDQTDHRAAQERSLIKHARKVIIPRSNLKDYSKAFPDFMEKIEVLGFPRVERPSRSQPTLLLEKVTNQLNCIFVGWLYPNLRSPTYLFELFERLPPYRYQLTIVGGTLGDFPSGYIESWQGRLGSRLRIIGPTTGDRAKDMLLDADVLINIGNKSTNQLPSKVLEYVSTGRPIVNFVKVEGCPTLHYTRAYPMALDIHEYEPLTDQVVSDFRDFCEANRGRTVAFEDVERLFLDDTIPVVTSHFEDILTKSSH